MQFPGKSSRRVTAAERDRQRSEAASYHEAGHAVAALDIDDRLISVSIVPQDETLGHPRYIRTPGWLKPDAETTPKGREFIETAVLGTLAGPAAEAHITGGWKEIRASSDYHDAAEFASYLFSEREVVEAYLDFKIVEAKNWIKHEGRWARIKAIANEISEQKELSRERVRDICVRVTAQALAASRRRRR
jgi:hypothetical protein